MNEFTLILDYPLFDGKPEFFRAPEKLCRADFEGIDIEFTLEKVKGKRILLCLWDIEQRPSRNCVIQLAKRAEELDRKGIAVVGIQISKIEKNEFDAWMKKNRISFPIGIVQGDTEGIRLTWGTRSFPWIILTDKQHVVTEEGFGVGDLDEKIESAK